MAKLIIHSDCRARHGLTTFVDSVYTRSDIYYSYTFGEIFEGVVSYYGDSPFIRRPWRYIAGVRQVREQCQ